MAAARKDRGDIAEILINKGASTEMVMMVCATVPFNLIVKAGCMITKLTECR